jgi:hypothetical protein
LEVLGRSCVLNTCISILGAAGECSPTEKLAGRGEMKKILRLYRTEADYFQIDIGIRVPSCLGVRLIFVVY